MEQRERDAQKNERETKTTLTIKWQKRNVGWHEKWWEFWKDFFLYKIFMFEVFILNFESTLIHKDQKSKTKTNFGEGSNWTQKIV